MKDKTLSSIFLLLVIFITIVLTIIINKFVFSTDFFRYEPKYLLTYIAFIISYNLSLIIVFPTLEIFEEIYIHSNEYKYTNEDDFTYYRDIIDKYSIGVLCHCYGKKIHFQDQIVATLLKLEKDNKIRISDTRIDILSEEGVSFSELMLIKSLKGIKIYSKKHIAKEIKNDNIAECRNCDLFEKEKTSTQEIAVKALVTSLILWLLNFIVIIVIGISIANNNNNIVASEVIMILWFSHFTTIFIPIILLSHFDNILLIKNQKGIETQKKLIGLKNFLKDNSLIHDRKIDDMKLWDYYIIYAIIFNLKGNLDKEAYNMYLKYIELINLEE